MLLPIGQLHDAAFVLRGGQAVQDESVLAATIQCRMLTIGHAYVLLQPVVQGIDAEVA
jgi:hypothetical protein